MKIIFSILFFILTNLVFSQATFTSAKNGNWSDSNPLTTPWTITGADDNGIPDFNDNVVIGHVIALSSISNANNVTINLNGTLDAKSNTLSIKGSFSNSGSVTNKLNLWFSGSGQKSITSTSNLTLNGLTVLGTTLNIPNGNNISLNLTNLSIRNSGILNNDGIFEFNSISTFGSTGNVLNNQSNGTITINSSISNTGLNINNNSTSNFIMNNGATSIFNTSYGNLTLQGNSTKTVQSNLTVNGDLIISAGSLSLGSNNMTVTGNLTTDGSISSTGTLNIAGNVSFTGSANLIGDNTVNLNGTSAQSFSSASSIAFFNLTCNNNAGVSLTSGTYTLSNILNVSAGNFNAGSNILTMLSDATKTSIIGSSAGTISGSMIMQRFMAPLNVYRKFDLGSCVSSATIDDWDNELFLSIGAPNNVAGYPGGDGDAPTLTGQPGRSVYIYNNQSVAANKYEPVVTGTTLQVGRGYQVIISDGTTNCTSNCFPGRAIDLRGTPNMGTISLPVFRTGSNGSNLVANPFQAHIDWNLVTKSNISNTVYFLEYNGTKSTYLTPRTNPIINPGMGFMCVATGSNPSVSIPQSAKTTSTSSDFGARLNSTNEDIVNLKLRISSTENSEYNEAELVFEKKSSPGFDLEKDFLFGESLDENVPVLTFTDSGKFIIRNFFNDELETVSFPLSISTPISGNYSIDLEGLYESSSYQDAYLINNLTKEKYSLTNNKSASIYFDKVENDQFNFVLSKKSNLEEANNSISNTITFFATSENLVIKNLANQIQHFDLKIYNVLGQLLFEVSNAVYGKSELIIPTEFLKSDIYVVKLKTTEGSEITKKVVLTK
jgi:hypothetical protein